MFAAPSLKSTPWTLSNIWPCVSISLTLRVQISRLPATRVTYRHTRPFVCSSPGLAVFRKWSRPKHSSGTWYLHQYLSHAQALLHRSNGLLLHFRRLPVHRHHPSPPTWNMCCWWQPKHLLVNFLAKINYWLCLTVVSDKSDTLGKILQLEVSMYSNCVRLFLARHTHNWAMLVEGQLFLRKYFRRKS